MRRVAEVVLALLLGAGCGDQKDEEPPPVPEGYVRYQAPTVTIAPGESGQWMHWVADPVDHDRNIADLIGAQGTGGHHAILYTSREVQPIGTTRVFENEDQAMIQFVGGVGGEGG